MLADGFYEWHRAGGLRRPVRIVMRSEEPFAFAGLWDLWRDPGGSAVPSCTIITTVANDLLRLIHDRLRAILPADLERFLVGS